MIAEKVVDEIRRLLAAGGHSQREIARLTGVSRGTVGAIAAGKRSDHDAPRHAGHPELNAPVGPLRRCGGCGGMVYMPCRLCRARDAKAALRHARARDESAEPEEPLKLNLREEHRVRYEQVRRGAMGKRSLPMCGESRAVLHG
jgi:transcriptional regulator with XRE-family HTH domain